MSSIKSIIIKKLVIPFAKTALAFVLIALHCNELHAQTASIDSLKKVIDTYKKEDTLQIANIIALAEMCKNVDPKLAIWYGKQAFELCMKTNEKYLTYDAINVLEGAYILQGKFDSVVFYLEKNIAFAKLQKNEKAEARELTNGASIYSQIGNVQKSIESFELAIAKMKKIKTWYNFIRYPLYNLSEVYSSKGNFSKALECALASLKIGEIEKDLQLVCALNMTIGKIYSLLENYETADIYLNRCFEIGKEIDDKEYPMYASYYKGSNLYNKKMYDSALYYQKKLIIDCAAIKNDVQLNLAKYSLALTYIKIKQLEKAYGFLKEVEVYSIENKNLERLSYVQIELGRIIGTCAKSELQKYKISEQIRYAVAKEYILKAKKYGDENNDKFIKKEAYTAFAEVDESNNNFVDAYDNYKKMIVLNDSISNTSIKSKVDLQISQFEFSKKEDSLKLLQANTNSTLQKTFFINTQQKQNLLLQNKELLLNKQSIITSNQKLALLQKDKELQHLVFLKTQAELQTIQLAKQANDKALSLTQSEKQIALSAVKTLHQQNENNILKRKQFIGYSLAMIGTLFFGILYFFSRNKNKQQQLHAQLEKEKVEQALIIAEQKTKEVELQKNITDITLSALRSQMNPHFIFNSLNSINSVVIQGNIPKASDYLTKFSKLIRLILENSKSNTIPIRKEMEALHLYLLMEKIRFQNKFEYTIEIEETLDIDKIVIPPTTIQPFIENAILHGLMHLNTKGILKVSIKNITNHLLEIVIDDNGVGRTKAAELKSKTNIHQSQGYQITKERITQLHFDNDIKILDKVDRDMKSIGTIVIIKLHY